jgi:PAS domain S-box-containing protein
VNALNTMASIVAQSLDVDEILNRAIDEVLHRVGVEAAAMFLLDARAGELVLTTHRGISEKMVGAAQRIKLGEGMGGKVAQTGQPMVIGSGSEYAGVLKTFYEGERLEAGASVPLVGSSGVIGVMSLATSKQQHFDTAGVELLMSLGRQIAIGVEKAQLYQETRNFAAELEQLVTTRTAELRRANRTLQVVRDANQALVRATEETELLRTVTEIIVRSSGYRMAWVGYAEDDAQQTVRPVAHAGYEDGYLATAEITWADAERGQGPTGVAIRTGQPVVAGDLLTEAGYDPWRAAALRRGYAASVALPLIAGGQILGALNIFAAEPGGFDAEEVKLLAELAGDLAFGVAALRTAAEYRRDEEALAESEERYRVLVEAMPIGISMTDPTGVVYAANRALQEITGYTLAELKELRIGIMYVDPAERRQLIQTLEETGRIQDYEVRLKRKNGAAYHALLNIEPLELRGQKAFLAVVRDITERKQAELRMQSQLDELRRWHTATLGRETRILELKREVNEALAQAGQPARYGSAETT